ncbi:ApeA N-terminal domain 1-containing protein [Longispora urticae]
MAVEIYGTWWVPGREQNTRTGVLKVDDRGKGDLEIDGLIPLIAHWVHGGAQPRSTPATAPVVYGQGFSGQKVTLLGAQSFITAVHATAVVIGGHVPGTDDTVAGDVPMFAGIDVEVEDLHVFAARSSISRVLLGRGPHTRTPLAYYSTVSDETATLNDGTVVTLERTMISGEDETRAGLQIRLSERTHLRFTSPSGTLMSINAFLKNVVTVQHLIAFAAGRECAILSLKLLLPEAQAGRPAPRADLHMFLGTAPDPAAKALRVEDMLFTLTDVNFSEIVPLWENQKKKFEGVIAGLRGARISDSMVETRMVNAATAAETLHTVLVPKAPGIPEADFKLIKKLLVDTLQEESELSEHVGWLRLLLFNRPTMEDRLSSLIEGLPAQTAERLLTPAGEDHQRQVAAWAWATKKARNEVAHTSLTKNNDTFGTYVTMKATTAVVELELLSILGFDDGHLHDVTTRRWGAIAVQLRDNVLPVYLAKNPPPAPPEEPAADGQLQAEPTPVEPQPEGEPEKEQPASQPEA